MKKFVLGFACALLVVWLKKRYSVKVTAVSDNEEPEEKDFQEVPGTGVQDGAPEPETGAEDPEPSTGNFIGIGYRNRVRV